jgi:pilus assembly protein Flp/PilA
MRGNSLKGFVSRLAADEGGATAVEYAILAALIAGAIIVAVQNVGTALGDTFNNISNKLTL